MDNLFAKLKELFTPKGDRTIKPVTQGKPLRDLPEVTLTVEQLHQIYGIEQNPHSAIDMRQYQLDKKLTNMQFQIDKQQELIQKLINTLDGVTQYMGESDA